MSEEKTTKKQQSVTARYEVVEIPATMTMVAKNITTGEVYDGLQLLCKIASDVEQLKQLI